VLVHPNICQILDFGVMEDRHFIAMEYVEGLDLSGVLNGLDRSHDRVPLDVVLYVTSCILRGLKHAHEAADEQGRALGIVHRDVSPHNVLLSINGDVKLSDLGAATANPEARSARTQRHFRLGKVLYMAPEQRRMAPVDGRADVYSTGILLTEMLLGITRFQKIANMYLAGLCTLSDEIVGSMSSDAGQQLADVIDRATEEDPANRYQSAEEMLSVVDQLLRDLAPGTSVDRVARLVKRTKRARDAAHRGTREDASANLSGPVAAVSLHTGDYLSVPDPSVPSSGPGLSAAPTDPRGEAGDEDVTLDVVAPSSRLPEAPVAKGLDDVPTSQQIRAPLDDEPDADDPGGLDDAPTLAMVRLPGGEYLDEAEPDTLAEPPPFGAVGPSPSVPVGPSPGGELDPSPNVELDRVYEAEADLDPPADTEVDDPAPSIALPAPSLDSIREGPAEREALGRRVVVLAILGLALLGGLGVGAILARGRWSAGTGGASLDIPAVPLPIAFDSGARRTLSDDPETPPPEAPLLEVPLALEPDGAADAAHADAGIEVAVAKLAVDASPPPDRDAGRRAGAGHKRRGFGYLNINSRPYGVPFVDGARVGAETPVARLKLVAGRHRVKVFFPQEKRHVTRHVRIRVGETAGVVIRLDD